MSLIKLKKKTNLILDQNILPFIKTKTITVHSCAFYSQE